MKDRLSLLAEAEIDLPAELGPANEVGPADIIDAAAAAWSAQRYLLGEAGSVTRCPKSLQMGAKSPSGIEEDPSAILPYARLHLFEAPGTWSDSKFVFDCLNFFLVADFRRSHPIHPQIGSAHSEVAASGTGRETTHAIEGPAGQGFLQDRGRVPCLRRRPQLGRISD